MVKAKKIKELTTSEFDNTIADGITLVETTSYE